MSAPSGSTEWMCVACPNPVAKLGDKLCPACTDSVSAADPHDESVRRAQQFLDDSDKATAFKNKDPQLANKDPQLAVAHALQGILVCQIQLLRDSAANMVGADGAFMMPAGTVMLPNEEPQPERGPKPWGM